jgi:hypothetical protein
VSITIANSAADFTNAVRGEMTFRKTVTADNLIIISISLLTGDGW